MHLAETQEHDQIRIFACIFSMHIESIYTIRKVYVFGLHRGSHSVASFYVAHFG